jgi:hypothetical protein
MNRGVVAENRKNFDSSSTQELSKYLWVRLIQGHTVVLYRVICGRRLRWPQTL